MTTTLELTQGKHTTKNTLARLIWVSPLAMLAASAANLGLYAGALGGPWIGDLFVGEAVVTSSSVMSPSVLAFAALATLGAWLILAGVPVAHFLRAQRTGLTLNRFRILPERWFEESTATATSRYVPGRRRPLRSLPFQANLFGPDAPAFVMRPLSRR